MIGEIETGHSGKSGSRRVVRSLPHNMAKAIMSKKVFLFRTNSLGTHGAALGSRSSKRWHGIKTEPLWLPRWVVRLRWTVLFEIAAAPTQVCELGEPCGKRARRACSLGRFFQVLRALIMMVGEERRFASVPLATCLYGL